MLPTTPHCRTAVPMLTTTWTPPLFPPLRHWQHYSAACLARLPVWVCSPQHSPCAPRFMYVLIPAFSIQRLASKREGGIHTIARFYWRGHKRLLAVLPMPVWTFYGLTPIHTHHYPIGTFLPTILHTFLYHCHTHCLWAHPHTLLAHHYLPLPRSTTTMYAARTRTTRTAFGPGRLRFALRGNADT